MKFEHVDLPKGQFVRLQPVSSVWLVSINMNSAVPPSCSPVFQYKYFHFSVFCMFQYFSVFYKRAPYMMYVLNSPGFHYFEILLVRNTDKSVYLEALTVQIIYYIQEFLCVYSTYNGVYM